MIDWISVLHTLQARQEASVLVLLVQVKGSTPRDAGAKMLVTQSESIGSIGGGTLEYRAIDEARRMLQNGGDQKPMCHLRTWHLGADAGQCCGGECTLVLETVPPLPALWLERLREYQDSVPCVLVTPLSGHDEGESDGKLIVAENVVEGKWPIDQEVIAPLVRRLLTASGQAAGTLQLVFRNPGDKRPAYLLERYGPDTFRLMIFGAGHVGKAIIRVMSGLPYHITWVDARADMFPASVPPHVTKIVSRRNEQIIAEAQPGTIFLVMTHSHPLDLELCECILKRGDFAYLGLIGSRTKRERFEKRLLQKGLGKEILKRLTCPIGIPGIPDKDPGAIAVAVAAQILQQRNTKHSMVEVPAILTTFASA
jgi:xanthine dehydrogenase accessory factor